MTEYALRVAGLTKRFGGLVAVDDVSFDVPAGQVFALIGPNGAGKTTLFNCITGIYKPTLGTVTFGTRNLTGSPPHRTAKAGILRTNGLRNGESPSTRWSCSSSSVSAARPTTTLATWLTGSSDGSRSRAP
jgi:ABC-type uncharacterized transport system ATPase subunit